MLHYKAEQNEADKNEHNTISGDGVVSMSNTCGQGKRETSIVYTWVPFWQNLQFSFRKRRKSPDLGSFLCPKLHGSNSMLTVSAPEGALGFLTESCCSIPCKAFLG